MVTETEIHPPTYLHCCLPLYLLCKSYLFLSSSFFFNWGILFLGNSVLLGLFDKKEKEMESKKEVGSSSSLTADLFGSKESSSSLSPSKGIFSSIFPPPPMVGGRNSSSSKVLESWPKQPLEGSAWRHGMQAPLAETATYNIPNKDRNSVFQEERMEPCHLSSSLYYGGQDIYSRSSSTQTSPSYPIFKKDGGEDDPNVNNSQDASRGNWWQGSLYY